MPPSIHFIQQDSTDAVIIFVHGFGGDATGTWAQFPRLIADDKGLDGWDVACLGYSSRLKIDFAKIWSADPELSTLSLQLSSILKLPPFQEYKAITLVAHSMGGLIVQRAILDDPGICQRVTNIFLFGTPSGGLVKAGLGKWLKRQARDMFHGGVFITKLRSDWQERFSQENGGHLPFTMTVAAGDTDEFVPSNSSLGPFADEQAYPVVNLAVVAGNHLEIVKPEAEGDPSFQLVRSILKGEAGITPQWNSARVAVELSDFQQTINQLQKVNGLDPKALVDLALALESKGQSNQALAVLEVNNSNHTDAMGVLAGRLKRRWLLQRVQDDGNRAIDLYSQSLELSINDEEWDQAYYHAINIAFMSLLFYDNNEKSSELASLAIQYCEKAGIYERHEKWRQATLGEAYLLLNQNEQALEHYANSLQLEGSQGPTPREQGSMYTQAMRIAEYFVDDQVGEQLAKLFLGEQKGEIDG